MTRKTIKSLVLFFAAALFVLGGCEKEEMVQSNHQRNPQVKSPGFGISYTIQDNVLIFETIEDYENAIQHTLVNEQFDWEENTDFVSMAKYYTANGKKLIFQLKNQIFQECLIRMALLELPSMFSKLI